MVTGLRSSKRAKEGSGPGSDSEMGEGTQPPWAELERSIKYHTSQAVDEVKAEFQAFREMFKEYQVRMETEQTRLKAVVSAAQDRIVALEAKVEMQDRSAREAHLILQNLPEGESRADLPGKVGSLLRPSPGAMITTFRLGPLRDGGNRRPRPVLVKFTSVQAKHDALKHSRELRGQKIYLDADLTPAQQGVRRAKAGRYRQLRDEGKKPFWRADRLFYYVQGRVQEEGVPPGPPPRGPAAASAGARSNRPPTVPAPWAPRQQQGNATPVSGQADAVPPQGAEPAASVGATATQGGSASSE